MKRKVYWGCMMLTLCLLAGCGSKEEEKNADAAGQKSQETLSEEETKDTGDDEEKEEEEKEQQKSIELENFTSGTIYEDGDYYFHIDSIETTEDAYVITYRASTDAQNYSGYYDMQLKVNGVIFHTDDFQFIYQDSKGYTMVGAGRERPVELVLPRTLLAHAGIQEINSLEFHVALGYQAHGSIYEEVEIDATVYPGAKTEAADIFPEPKQDSWVLVDNEQGKAQIVDANYWVSAADGHIMGVTFHILSQAKGDDGGMVGLRNLTVGDWTSSDSMGDVVCHLTPEVRYFRFTLKGGDDPQEGADYSQSVLKYYYQEDDLEELTATLDLSGLADK
ncbi:MAG TPA: hypothetical protein IAB98_09790 [Candidatus Egerieimonas intestinavium]|uniref:Uncharacterized protein n=1 Tax=Candidatus Egerieimonas intestinavium TaxID=2840777 RepID=A0A9D1EKY0_9FIRM|nr:hypothetical protein [Candidatus Egerieimonas intestinavium]